ncbi:type IV pilus secretin family protein [Beggiatoa leptomitoformis]|nr:type IV pilus secretin family protein [Beggiatoa leptomitoformis]
MSLGSFSTAQAAINQLDKVGFSTLPGNRVQINLDFAGNAQTPISFSTENPARIVLDFPNTAMRVDNRSQVIGIGAVQGANVVETNDRTRVVLNLVRLVPFTIQSQGNRVYVEVANVGNQIAPPANSPITAVSQKAATLSAKAVEAPRGPRIENINFKRTREDSAQIIITLSDPESIVNIQREVNDLIVDIEDTALPESLDRKLDVTDFATPVSFIDAKQQGKNVRMVITPKNNEFDHLAYQSDNQYIIEVKPLTADEKETLKKTDPAYAGQRVSFNIQNIPVSSALMLLTELPGVNLNIITSPAVSQLPPISLRLKNVPWDQALEIILQSQGLGKKQIGNVMTIDLKTNLDERERKELEAQKAIKELEPVVTRQFQINYAKASDLVSLLRESSAEKSHSFLSERGSVTQDVRTNKLIIQDTATKLDEIAVLVAAIDTPIRQVLIEGRVVIAEESFGKSLGVKFGYGADQDLGSGYGVVVGGKTTGDTEFSSGTSFQVDGNEGLMVSLPAVASAIGASATSQTASVGLAIGKIGSYLLQLELSALQVEGRGEVISSPRVVTSNQKKATVLQGVEFPVAGTAGVGATAAPTFKEALLQLDVTPQITPDDRVIMDLNVKKDDVASTSGSINRREVETQVLVDNGETVVLGGVYEQKTENKVERVPFFSDLPLVGNLFKTRTNTENKSELLIFITPRIIKGNS